MVAETRKVSGTSETQDYFRVMFDGADLISSFWQPMLKSVGRWHLEVAGLTVKQGQAALQLSRDLSRSMTPADVASAHARYWDAVTSQYSQSSQRLAASVARTVEAPRVSEVVPLPLKPRGHDVIELPDAVTARPEAPERKVA
jgi:hypothetical protein